MIGGRLSNRVLFNEVITFFNICILHFNRFPLFFLDPEYILAQVIVIHQKYNMHLTLI